MTGPDPLLEPGSRVLVTGAASGIGLATVRKALAAGAHVVAVDRDLDALRAHLAGTPAGVLQADMTELDTLADCVARADDLLGGCPDSLVHCAGQYLIRPALDLTPQEWRGTQDVNATGTFFMAQAFALHLVAAGRPGSIVVLSSTAARRGDCSEPAAHYSSSKAAVEAITRQLAIELGPLGIRVNCVTPGLIETPMLRITDDPEAATAFVSGSLPLRRLGQPEDVADACLFLIGPRSSYVSGAALVVDGALTAS